ncbi:hypothetical protein SADUNF_Sadunf04G0077200 [Salix dunnii]|uniref:Uncharacterized protein n=1 Tax=Salix dunnii TaxID=1413687 RepID=A0A835N0M7_9ROSI|nr:hypothetical protein SADUNF_Sadunf04G0077200 [Salix dunnii]
MTEITTDSTTSATSLSSPPTKIHQSHPALTVSNITTFIKVTLDIEKGQYITWSELFKIHARAYQVMDHIIPASSEKNTQTPSIQDMDPDLWSRVDAIVLQWIYSTISEDLLNTILERDSTAETAWNRLKDIFSDNKNSRALYLEQEFSKVQMENFTDASSYCQHLKSLSDQLANVGAPVSNERLVLQLLSGLTEAYSNIGSQIRHGDSLPLFYKARSMLVLEETARMKKAAQSPPNSAFFVSPAANSGGHYTRNPHHRTHPHHNNRSSFNRGGRGGGHGARGGKGRGKNGGRGSQWHGHTTAWQPGYAPQHQTTSHQMGNAYYGQERQQPTYGQAPWAGPWPQWASPPCPYPTAGQPTQRQPSILGPRPQQAHMAAVTPQAQSTQQAHSSYAPTDIQAAMHTLSIAPPDDQWYMDTGATSHMTANGGAEGCSSSESGWTMYLASPMQEDDEECSYDGNGYNSHNVSKTYRSAADEDSDDSMASDASSGLHNQKTHESGHGTVHFKFSKGGLFNLFSSSPKPEKKDKKSDKKSAKKSRKLDDHGKHKK